MSTPRQTPLARVEGLSKHYHLGEATQRALHNVSLRIYPGETVGLVGESGSGKSTLGKLLLRLVEPTEGQIFFEQREITRLGTRAMRPLRREMQLIPQDPFSALNPQRSIGWALAEPFRIHKVGSPSEWEQRCAALLSVVGISAEVLDAYPLEFSGGQLQRIGIARALALNPRLIVCDEAVSALDVSIQAQILKLLQDLQAERGLSYLFISHNLAVIERVSHYVVVLYAGEVMEQGRVEQIFEHPAHPYTQTLLASVPRINSHAETIDASAHSGLGSATGAGTGAQDQSTGDTRSVGCPFLPRCASALDICATVNPPLRTLAPGHQVACHLHTSNALPTP